MWFWNVEWFTKCDRYYCPEIISEIFLILVVANETVVIELFCWLLIFFGFNRICRQLIYCLTFDLTWPDLTYIYGLLKFTAYLFILPEKLVTPFQEIAHKFLLKNVLKCSFVYLSECLQGITNVYELISLVDYICNNSSWLWK